jgi:hypothetical protein
MNLLISIKPDTLVVLKGPDGTPLHYQVGSYGAHHRDPQSAELFGPEVELTVHPDSRESAEKLGFPSSLELNLPLSPAADASATVPQIANLLS